MRTGVKMKPVNKKLDPTRKSESAVDFESTMRQKVVGQDPALERVTEMYQTFLAGLTTPGRPIGNLLFLGPTGTGKTRVVEAMAEALFGDPRAVVKIDCAEFQHSHEIAKLIGSPPGYLGHRETHPLLTQEALNAHHTDKTKLTLVLFDEIEKASDSLWQLLLGIMDKATLTLGDNRRVDLSQCMIFLTSNLGAHDMMEIQEGGMGFHNALEEQSFNKLDDKLTRVASEAAKRKFSPEFMNRIDKTVVFKTLREEHLQTILDIELGMVQQRILQGQGSSQFVFAVSPAMKAVLISEGFNRTYGARHLKRVIEKKLIHPMANLVSSGQVKLGDFIRVDIDAEGETVFTTEGEGALVPVLLEKWGADFGVSAVTKAVKAKSTKVEDKRKMMGDWGIPLERIEDVKSDAPSPRPEPRKPKNTE
jgi:ATP-dependent Clp protease ATP-binding subunit ClpB